MPPTARGPHERWGGVEVRPRAAILFLDALLLFSVVLLVLVVAVSVIAVRYPRSARRAVAMVSFNHAQTAAAVANAGQMARSLAGRASEGFEYRVVGPWLRLTQARTGGSRPRSAADTVPAAVRERDCLGCHPDYARKLRFGDIYFSHAAHRGARGDCAACHTGSGPHRCRSPEMDGCGSCHTLSGKDAECETCHAPGTVFHGARLAGDRGKADDCNVCHPSQSLEPEPRAHTISSASTTRGSCEGCHEADFCSDCHPAPHAPGYERGHQADMAARVVTPARCWSCHDAGWCALACHSGEHALRGGGG